MRICSLLHPSSYNCLHWFTFLLSSTHLYIRYIISTASVYHVSFLSQKFTCLVSLDVIEYLFKVNKKVLFQIGKNIPFFSFVLLFFFFENRGDLNEGVRRASVNENGLNFKLNTLLSLMQCFNSFWWYWLTERFGNQFD